MRGTGKYDDGSRSIGGGAISRQFETILGSMPPKHLHLFFHFTIVQWPHIGSESPPDPRAQYHMD
jgi:hypothetical protein